MASTTSAEPVPEQPSAPASANEEPSTSAEPVSEEPSAPESALEGAPTTGIVVDHQPSLAEIVAATITSPTDPAPEPPITEPEAANTSNELEDQALNMPESETVVQVETPQVGAAEDGADGTVENQATSAEAISGGSDNAPEVTEDSASTRSTMEGLHVFHPEADPTVTIIRPSGHVAPDANDEDVPAPITGPISWEILDRDRLPPLLQGMAPRFPPQEGAEALQKERLQWRESWKLYARSIFYVANHMRVQLLLDGFEGQAILEAYNDIQKSINEDIIEVMKLNRDVGDPGRNLNKFTRRTHSYLAWSENILRQHQTDVENCLGSSENKKWHIGGGTKVRQFGQLYPGDDFREILHFRPQSNVAPPERSWPEVLPTALTIGLLLLVLGWLSYELSLPSIFWHSVCWLASLPNAIISWAWSWLNSFLSWVWAWFASFVAWAWLSLLPLRNAISNGSWSAASTTSYTASSTDSEITKSAFLPTTYGLQRPSSVGASQNLFDSSPLEFKVSGTMKILQAVHLD